MSQDVGGADAVEVTRATLAYDQIEDRISLTCALNNHERVVLWLTARLASQLARYLCAVVAPVPEMAAVYEEEELANHAASITKDRSQSWAPETPVIAQAASISWMVTAIDISNGPMLVQLRFRDDQGHATVQLSLEHTQLANWLNGLKHCFSLAGWSMDCWHMPASAGPQRHATRQAAVH